MNKLKEFFNKQWNNVPEADEGDEFQVSSEAPEPQNAYFKSTPIKIAMVGIIIFAAFAILMGNMRTSAKREELKASAQSEAQDRNQAAKKNIGNAPDNYSVLARMRAEEEQQKQRQERLEDGIPVEKPAIPVPPAVPHQPATENSKQGPDMLLKSKEAANNSPILFKVNK